MNHALGDGIGALLFTLCFAHGDPKIYMPSPVRIIPWYIKLIQHYMLLFSWFFICRAGYRMAKYENNDKFALLQQRGDKTQLASSQEYSVNELKQKVCRKYQCTINDFILTILSLTLNEYCDQTKCSKVS